MKHRKALIALVFLLPALAAAALRLAQPENVVDDAYITFRYARHLAAGEGLVYNPGEAVLGTSSPAWAIILAGLSRLAGEGRIPAMAVAVSAVLDGLTTFLLGWLVFRAGRGLGWGGRCFAAALTSLLFAMNARSVDFSTSGMEAPLFGLCLVATALALASGRFRWAAILTGVSVWVRPDGGLLVAGLLACLAWRRRRVPWVETALAFLPVAAALTLALWLYGDYLPSSLRAKSSGVYQLPLDHALRYLCRHLAALTHPLVPVGRLLGGLPPAPREYISLAATSLLPVALMAAGVVQRRRYQRLEVLFMVLYAALFLVSFAVANPFMMGWYYVPLETSYLVLLGLGTAAVTTRVARCNLPGGFGPTVAVAVVLVLLLAWPQLSRYQWLPLPGGRAATVRSEWEKVRERDYLRVGSDIQGQMPGARVAAAEIGALGYAYSGPILDTVGLVSPDARRYYPLLREEVAGNYGIPPDLIADQAPDAVVFLEIFGRKGLLQDPRFRQDYRLWRQYPSRTFGSRGLLVYVRRSTLW